MPFFFFFKDLRAREIGGTSGEERESVSPMSKEHDLALSQHTGIMTLVENRCLTLTEPPRGGPCYANVLRRFFFLHKR